ncbi:carbohydrate ABC transporter permease [Anaerocolumna sp. AGMB13025]|uniref:carbohydrate ABC transporter permease n=1 Tax=Anaerocolumna sp. AGMB13025 TaxID=3039116 RepID=UPI0024202732|nr:carbohydrate ABC transporter permease [Anaerocolumna sp. AGMB13025]WFR58673.1 carbohydrate ABC transporter permease [Anaerocolumna sp. AGMB13025]
MKKKISLGIKYIFLCMISFLFVFPFLWMLFGAFKSNNEIWQTPYQLFPKHINLTELAANLKAVNLYGYLGNSFFVGAVGTVLILLVSGMFAYAVVFLKSKNMDRIFAIVLITYMLPGAVTYVPAYVILAKLQLLDKLSGLIFSYLANVFAVFYFRQSFMKTSMDFVEAAKIDGANHRLILRHVILPLNKSAFWSVGLITFIQLYNSYMWPSIMLKSQEKYLISQGLRQFFIQDGAYGMNWSQIMLASTITILPVVILLIVAQKWLMAAISQDSGVKF